MKSAAEFLGELIRIPSNSAVSNRPLVEYAKSVLRNASWSARELAYRDPAGVEKVNLIAAPPGQDVEAHDVDLAFVCHTDTVPFAADWKRALDPFVEDEKVHGCGACDVKGFLACLLATIVESDPSEFASCLRLVLTADEEIGCIGAKRVLAEDVLRPRRMVIGEPTSLHPARAGKGYCLAEITVHGKEAHSAHPEQGISAIYGAARLITAIETLAAQPAREQNPFFAPAFTTLNVGMIQGGTAKNVVPGECRFLLEWRPIPGQSADAVLQSVAGVVTRMKDVDSSLEATITPLRQQSGFETDAKALLVRTIEALAGKSAISIPFGSEASIFAPGVPEIVVWGPGDMRTAHSSRECVPIAELDAAVACLRSLMHRR